MADIFVSYTSQDREWAFWIGQELEKLGHVVHIHDWEIPGGGDIAAWMEERHDKADHILCVISDTYLAKPYSSWERRAAQWASQRDRPGFALPVRIEDCKLPTLLASIKHCDLFEIEDDEARQRLIDFLAPAAKPTGPVQFPGTKKKMSSGALLARAPVAFPGGVNLKEKLPSGPLSNITINLPRHFLGRDEELDAIEQALSNNEGRVAITALHGLRGVGKTILAAAYAKLRCRTFRATWWIRAETESTIRADLVGLGVQIGWIQADAAEEPALAGTLEQLRQDGKGILLIYDNAITPNTLSKFLPDGAGPYIIITSNAPNWGGVADSIGIGAWPRNVGADFLMARSGRAAERDAALGLSEVLGGLPLAHEQAAAYCERIGISITDYLTRFERSPSIMLDVAKDASQQYHDGRTVSKTFALAIEEAAKLHKAAEPLIRYAALLAPEPIPLFLFVEGREEFSEPFASALAGEGLDEAVGALRAFALVDRESIPDERDPSITTDTIRLHRLVREVAASRRSAKARAEIYCELIAATARAYPSDVHRNPAAWPWARRLDAIALALVGGSEDLPQGSEIFAATLLNGLSSYRLGALAAYANARKLMERALALRERALGPDHSDAATNLNNLGYLLRVQGDLAGARSYYERALALREKALGSEHPKTATSLNNLGSLLQLQGDLAGARPYYERALAIREEALGPDHPDTATSLNNLGYLLRAQGDLTGARPYYERALAITESALDPEHLVTAISFNNLGGLLQEQGDLTGARPYYERALAIREKALGPDHPDTARSLNNLGGLLRVQGDLVGARPYYERALAIREKALGPDHPDTANSLNNLGGLLRVQDDLVGARPHYERALAIREKALGPDHPDTANSLNNLGGLLQAQGDLAGARPYCERALGIFEKKLGAAHPDTQTVASNLAILFDQLKLQEEARALRRKFNIPN